MSLIKLEKGVSLVKIHCKSITPFCHSERSEES